MTDLSNGKLLTMTTDIVSSYVTKNTVRADEISGLILTVHASLAGIAAPKPVEEPAPAPTPAVSIKKSITDDHLICLDDGKKFKSLKRHLAQLGMTPDEYRSKWGLPRDYPMVAPGYAAQRSELARASGLGASRKRAAVSEQQATPAPPPAKAARAAVTAPAPAAPEPEAPPAEAPAKRRGGRPAKKAA